MTIAVSCTCGKTLNVPDQYAGKRIKCTGCGQPVSVPDAASPPSATPASSGQGAVATCTCGAKLRVTPQLAGKKVRCPKCQSPLQLPGAGTASPTPAAPAPVAPTQPAPTPVVSAPVVDHTLWDEIAPAVPETPNFDEFLEEEEGPSAPDDMAANEAMAYIIRELHGGRSPEDIQLELERKGMKPDEAERLLASLVGEQRSGNARATTRKTLGATKSEFAMGLFATVSGCHLIYTFFWLVKLKSDFGLAIGFQSIGAAYMLLGFVRTGMGFGITLGGISILIRREIGLSMGVIAAYVFFALTAVSFVLMIVFTVKFAAENPGSGGGALNLKFLFSSPKVVLYLARHFLLDLGGAAILVYLDQRHR